MNLLSPQKITVEAAAYGGVADSTRTSPTTPKRNLVTTSVTAQEATSAVKNGERNINELKTIDIIE